MGGLGQVGVGLELGGEASVSRYVGGWVGACVSRETWVDAADLNDQRHGQRLPTKHFIPHHDVFTVIVILSIVQ